MAKSKVKRDSLPEEFISIEEAANFWDTHSLADYEDLQKDIEIEVELKSEKNYFAIEKELSDSIDKLAQMKGVLPETLVNLWLKEKINEKLTEACAKQSFSYQAGESPANPKHSQQDYTESCGEPVDNMQLINKT